MARLEAVQGDITRRDVEAIDLLEECRRVGGCPTGEARLTRGYRLPARYVIHTVGPVWTGGDHGEAELLRACYRSCLRLATREGIHSLAFPSISTGAYGYPVEAASRIAVDTVREDVGSSDVIQLVRFVCFSAGDLAVYRKLLGA